MWRRWIIRGLFILPILFYVTGWVWSVKNHGFIKYAYAGHSASCESVCGDVGFTWGWFREMPGRSHGWQSGVDRQDEAHALPPIDLFPSSFFGFIFVHDVDTYDEHYALCVPFWFLIIVCSVLLFVVWRKTRPKINPKLAFPVEMASRPK